MGSIWFAFVGFLEQMVLLFGVVTGSVGLGIVLFTVLVRLLILPLTLTSIRSGRKMQELQPLTKELQRKYGKDKQKLQEETLKLYKQYKINPVGGCLPMLLQLPIFIGVYQAVYHLMVPGQLEFLGDAPRVALLENNIQPLLEQPLMGSIWAFAGLDSPTILVELLQQPFLGLNLGLAAFENNFAAFNGWEYLLLPILSVVMQFMQQMMAMPRVQDPQQKMMSQMMMFMPLVFAYIAFTFPAGAVVYWVTSSLVGVTQQYFITGWGSLANYLTFLPADRERKPALNIVPAAAGEGGDVAALTAPERPAFWDIMRPLTESETQIVDTHATGTTADEPDERASASDDGPASSDPDHKERQARKRAQRQSTQRRRRRS